jgi:ribulose kinase
MSKINQILDFLFESWLFKTFKQLRLKEIHKSSSFLSILKDWQENRSNMKDQNSLAEFVENQLESSISSTAPID